MHALYEEDYLSQFSKAVWNRNILKKIVQKDIQTCALKLERLRWNYHSIAGSYCSLLIANEQEQPNSNSSLPCNGPKSSRVSQNQSGFQKRRLNPGKKEHGCLKDTPYIL